jgi:hypothetical protein
MGVRSLLCGDNGCELEVSLHLTHRLLNRDHNLFDRSGVAFSEAGHDRSIAIGREIQPASLSSAIWIEIDRVSMLP